MKYSAALFLIFLFTISVFAQNPKPTAKPPNSQTQAKAKINNNKTAPKNVGNEKEDFDKAVALTDAAQRIKALQTFLEDFPESSEKIRARELIVSARAELGEAKLQAGETEKGLEFFKLAVKDAPQPMSEKLFADVILQFPTNLFFRGQRTAAFDVADLIEEKAEGNAKQLLGLATFYLGIESATSARRLANKAIEIETASETEKKNLAVAYQTLGLANRMGFQLEDAANAYARALELDPESSVSKRSLAEMKRATGKFDEAINLYRELIAKDENDLTAKTGLTLSLFDAGKRVEAEAEMSKTLEANAGNLPLLVGAAYWYAAKNEGAKAVELAAEAIKIEPRYTWAYIAMGRGFMAQKLPLEAEKALVAARNYGSFPTLNYEIAAARLQAGFYREAADELKNNFAVKDGMLETRLGGRITVEAEDFIKLLSLERQASIFAQNPADTVETAQKLKSLLEFSEEINSPDENPEAISAAADEFVRGDDKMKIHRQLFVATRLLDKRKALPKVLEMTQAAVRGVDSALDVPHPSAAVMADELYETRTLAMSRNEILLVPEVPRQTLSVILRGRIEEITGWALYQQDKAGEAVTRLKRAISVLPEKSSWWRSSVWRLGTALEADGKQEEALGNYVKAYTGSEQPDPTKYIVIESLYQKVNGSTEGLEEKIGARPAGIADAIARAAAAESNTKPTGSTEESQEIKANIEPENPAPLPSPQSAPETVTKTNIESIPEPKKDESLTEEIKSDLQTEDKEDLPEEDSTPAEPKLQETEKTESEETETENQQAENTLVIKEKPEAVEEESESESEVSAEPEISPRPDPKSEETPPVEEIPVTETTENPPVDEDQTSEAEAETDTEKETESETEKKPEVSDAPQIEKVSADDLEEIKPLPESEAPPQPETTPEIQPPVSDTSEKKPAKLSVVITENASPKPVKETAKKSSETNTASKQVFDPVIINLPQTELPNKPKPQKHILENPPVYEIKKPAPAEAKNDSEETRKKTGGSEVSFATRPRVIIEDKLKPPAAENPQCKISVSQENISLINNGGSIGILVETEDSGAIEELTAVSSSPQDITAIREKELGAARGRVFFVIKSVSEKIGIYTVTIESPCGRKEIQIRVR